MSDWKEMIPKDCKFNQMHPIMDRLEVIAEETKNPTPISKNPVSIDGVEYASCKVAGVSLGLDEREVDERIYSKSLLYIGYIYTE